MKENLRETKREEKKEELFYCVGCFIFACLVGIGLFERADMFFKAMLTIGCLSLIISAVAVTIRIISIKIYKIIKRKF